MLQESARGSAFPWLQGPIVPAILTLALEMRKMARMAPENLAINRSGLSPESSYACTYCIWHDWNPQACLVCAGIASQTVEVVHMLSSACFASSCCLLCAVRCHVCQLCANSNSSTCSCRAWKRCLAPPNSMLHMLLHLQARQSADLDSMAFAVGIKE